MQKLQRYTISAKAKTIRQLQPVVTNLVKRWAESSHMQAEGKAIHLSEILLCMTHNRTA